MMQTLNNGAALYQAVKWTLAGAQLMAQALQRTTDYADNVTTLLNDARSKCADNGADPELEEALSVLTTRANHLIQGSGVASDGAHRIEQVCQTVFRPLLVSPMTATTTPDFDELEHTIARVNGDVEDMAETLTALTEGLHEVYDHLTHGFAAQSPAVAPLEQAVEAVRELSALINATRDAMATATDGVYKAEESTASA